LVTITTSNGTVVEQTPAGPDLIVAEGQQVAAGEPLTVNPNVGQINPVFLGKTGFKSL
jgi:apocytochrome f